MTTLPIKKVLVMEDRAQIERAGSISVTGVTKVELPGLPLIAVDRSLQMHVRGATLIDAHFERRWKEQPAGGLSADASELRRKVHALERQEAEDRDAQARVTARLQLLATARADLLRAVSQQAGHGTADVATWDQQLSVVTAKQAELEEAARVAQQAAQRTRQRLAEARGALASAEAATQVRECALHLTLDGSGTAEVQVSYLVPCAVWRPAYRATLGATAVQLAAEAVVWQRTGEDWADVELLFSTARPTLGTTPPRLAEDMLVTRPKEDLEKRVVDVAIREEVIQTAGEGGGSPELPGLDDGGETQVLKALGATSVKSDGHPHRVALFGFETKATVEWVCPAELSNLVFVQARFENTSGQVLLAGPVDLIRDSGLVGRAQLKFAAPGEVVKLSFGNEDGLRVVRDVSQSTEEARLTGRRTTTHVVTLHVSNMRNAPAKLIIEERIPVSEVKQVEVQVKEKDCQPTPSAVTRDGIARLELELASQANRRAKFVWTLEAASKVAGV